MLLKSENERVSYVPYVNGMIIYFSLDMNFSYKPTLMFYRGSFGLHNRRFPPVRTNNEAHLLNTQVETDGPRKFCQ